MIVFFNEDIDFNVLKPRLTKAWLKSVAVAEGFSVNQLNYIFCSDQYLLAMNQQYLAHDYFTDIITFDNSDENSTAIHGDIFVSIERIVDNSKTLDAEFASEFLRVIVHGVLHLCGYDDTTEVLKSEIRAKEDFYIKLYNSTKNS